MDTRTGSGVSTSTKSNSASIALAFVPARAEDRHFSTIPVTANGRAL